jgi:hypothetical protein
MTLSCGHQEDEELEYGGYPVSVKEYTRENTKAVAYKVICKDCYEYSDKVGILLKSEEEEMTYLREED